MPGHRPIVDQRAALAALIEVGDVVAPIRDEIGASWRRSVGAGLHPDHFEVPQGAGYDTDGPLARAAGPVLDRLTDDLAMTGMGVLLASEDGQVLDRRVTDRTMHDRLDRILLAPGFVYAEEQVGTNAIGAALAERRPSVVEGREHFADALTSMACAAYPIEDPRDGRLVGVIDLSCAAGDGSALMLPLVRRAATDVAERLLADRGAATRALVDRFARQRKGGNAALAFVNAETVVANPMARAVVEVSDAATLWESVAPMLVGPRRPREVRLRGGTVVVLAADPVLDGGELIGASITLGDIAAAGSGRLDKREAFGWGSLTATELLVSEEICRGLTNREAGRKLIMSPYTVDSHLRSIYRKLGLNSRVALVRAAAGRGGSPD